MPGLPAEAEELEVYIRVCHRHFRLQLAPQPCSKVSSEQAVRAVLGKQTACRGDVGPHETLTFDRRLAVDEHQRADGSVAHGRLGDRRNDRHEPIRRIDKRAQVNPSIAGVAELRGLLRSICKRGCQSENEDQGCPAGESSLHDKLEHECLLCRAAHYHCRGRDSGTGSV